MLQLGVIDSLNGTHFEQQHLKQPGCLKGGLCGVCTRGNRALCYKGDALGHNSKQNRRPSQFLGPVHVLLLSKLLSPPSSQTSSTLFSLPYSQTCSTCKFLSACSCLELVEVAELVLPDRKPSASRGPARCWVKFSCRGKTFLTWCWVRFRADNPLTKLAPHLLATASV
eukprot:1157194-Pelagomonas_calceolata.AAC.2